MSEDVRKSDLLAELTDFMSDGVSQDLWILSIGIDNNPWGQYQPLIPAPDFLCIFTIFQLAPCEWQVGTHAEVWGKNLPFYLQIA